MSKRFYLMSVTALVLAFCMTQSVIAKTITYMGYQYKGKINKDNIPEGKGTIIMSVSDLIDKSKMIEFSIKGNFNGPIVTDAYFSTTWLSYKGDIEIKEGNVFVLKKGGIITTNAYDFGNSLYSTVIESNSTHYDVSLTEDRNSTYAGLTKVSMPVKCKFPKGLPYAVQNLNPPSEVYSEIFPSINRIQYKEITGGKINWVNSKIVYYNLNAKLPNPVKDSEGRIWKFDNNLRSVISVEYPDGSFCNEESMFERVHARYVPKLKRDRNSCDICIDGQINNKPIILHIFSGQPEAKKCKRYFLGVDSLLEFPERQNTEIDLYDNNYRYHEEVIETVDIKKIIKEKLLPYIHISDNMELSIFCSKKDHIGDRVKILSVKNGVVLGKKEIAAAAAKEEAAQQKKDLAEYTKLCNRYGKKYVDAYMNDEIIVGMPEGLVKKFVHRIKSQSAVSKVYYMLPYSGAPDIKRVKTVYVTNGKVTSFTNHR